MPRRPFMTPLVVANWKMQLSVAESHQHLATLKTKLRSRRSRVRAIVCPSYVALPGAKTKLRGSPVILGAQDMHWDERGAYTGQVSPLDLQALGVEYVIIGHSERRYLLGETDDMISRKVFAALAHGLNPILCVGETAHERNENRQEQVVRQQLTQALRIAPPPAVNGRLSIVYEPIWAVGTGEPASPSQANDMRHLIRQVLVDLYSLPQVEQSFRILYGGSVTPANIADYVNPQGFQGVLVGGASLEPDSFLALINQISTRFSPTHV